MIRKYKMSSTPSRFSEAPASEVGLGTRLAAMSFEELEAFAKEHSIDLGQVSTVPGALKKIQVSLPK